MTHAGDKFERVRLDELLQEESQREIATRESEWAHFSDTVLRQIDGEVASQKSLSDTIRAGLSAEIGEPDFSGFLSEVMERVDAPEGVELAAPVRAALVESVNVEVDAQPFERFADQVLARVEAARDAELAQEDLQMRELLEDEMRDEVGARDRSWGAMKHAVMQEIASLPAPALDSQAVERFAHEVSTEVQSREPEFQQSFERSVEKRIDIEPSWWARLREWISDNSWISGLSAAAATAVVLFAIIPGEAPVTPPPTTPAPIQVDPEPVEVAIGEVDVDEVAFEGGVAVMEGEGATIVWLTAPEDA